MHYGLYPSEKNQACQVWYLIVSIPDRCTLTYFELAVIQHNDQAFKRVL